MPAAGASDLVGNAVSGLCRLTKTLTCKHPAAAPTITDQTDEGILKVDARKRLERYPPAGQRREYTLWRQRTPPFPSFTGLVEPAEEGKIGIACSGGGIRSAAFSLGALQVLQSQGKLRRASYLAGVSGGSYIASAFCMVRRTWRSDTDERPEGSDDSDPRVVNTDHPPFFPGSPEEQYLRNRSSYMAPGAFGIIQFGYRLLLGMAINFVFIAAAVVTCALPLGLLYGAVYPSLTAHVDPKGLCRPLVPGRPPSEALCHFVPLEIPTALWLAPTIVVAIAIVVTVASIVAYHLSGEIAEALQIWSLRALLLSGAFAFLLIAMPMLLSLVRDLGAAARVPEAKPLGAHEATPVAAAAGVGGATTLAAAVLLELRTDWARAKAVAAEVGKKREWLAKLSSRTRELLAYAIAATIGPALMLLVALASMTALLNFTHAWVAWAFIFGFGLGFSLIYFFADMTTWSLHSFYRRRLCTAFALKREARPGAHPAPDGANVEVAGGRRRPWLRYWRRERRREYPPIAAVDAGIAVERNYHQMARLSETALIRDDGGGPWPTLLVCAAANISDTAATPPGRGVTSFTFSATAIGGPLVGAVSTRDLEDSCDRARLSYMTLPAAVAMSGAALSPSMGKMTRGPLRFLMALANVRLGVWVPNPRRIGLFERSEERAEGRRLRPSPYPRPRASYLLRELLGFNSIDAPYLYVTDGGHYENLGLVELLRRGCTEIYVFDASNDDFGAIGDAVALARSELDVDLDVNYEELKPEGQPPISKTDCIDATITFPAIAGGAVAGDQPITGTLHYARLTMTAESPADAKAYAAQDKRFPHDPTADQLYTDQRFEAYRSLGAQAARTALKQRYEPGPAT